MALEPMRTWTATTSAPPSAAWALLARPQAWSRWAPHVSGAWGLGDPEVRPGAIGAARVFGRLPLLARITDVQPGRAWVWRIGAVGLLEMVHRVEPRPGGGCEVAVDVLALPPLDRVVELTYGGWIREGLTTLAREAERDAGVPAFTPEPASAGDYAVGGGAPDAPRVPGAPIGHL